MNNIVGKGIDGKAFVKALDACKDKSEVFELLSKNMDNETLRDRIKYVKDNDLINNLEDKKARVNIEHGFRVSHADLAVLAAKRYTALTGQNVKFFKAECNKYITKKEAEKQKQAEQTKVIMHDLQR